MCCKKDDILTKEYQAKTEPIIAWKIMVIDRDNLRLRSQGWWNSRGGIVYSSGEVISNRNDKETCQEGFYHRGCHAYVDEYSDTTAVSKYLLRFVGIRRAIVKVVIQPEDIVAVGEMWQDRHDRPTLINKDTPTLTIVCMKYTITQEEWDRIFPPK